MRDADWSRVRALFQAASDVPAPERRAFIDREAGGDELLRDEVLALFASLDRAEGFLDSTRVGPAAGFDALADGPQPSRETVGPWRVLRTLGHGGMGMVYLGERVAGDVPLRAAVKIVVGADSTDVLRRFHTERRILAALDHPGIARLLDGGTTDDGLPYFALEFVEGVPLTEYAARLELAARLALFRQVCDAVEFAHRRLVVHRDLKPGNILVAADGRPKLLDFGIAKILNPSHDTGVPATVTVHGWMTPAYASPEQLRGETTTTATDVYSLGLILYELLTGRAAIAPGTDPIASLRAKVDGAIARPSTVGPGHTALRGDLDTIVMKALAAEPERRYASAAALSDEIDRYLTGRPVLARPDTYRYRAGKFVRRHRWAVGFAALAAVALAAGLVFALLGLQRARRAETDALASARTAERVSEFMVGLFAVADPGEARGNAVTARELLDRGADRIAKDLEAEPTVKSRLRGVMARAYRELGLYERQAALLQTELEERTRRGDAATIDGLAVLVDLSYAEGRRGRFKESRDLAEQAMQGFEAQGTTAGAPLARAHSQAGISYWQLGNMDRARDLLERSLVLYDALPAPNPRDVIAILNNVAILRWQKNDVKGARPLYERALALGVETYGEEHPSVASTLNNLALVEMRAGEYDAALAHHHRALAVRRKMLAADHPDIAETLNNICDLELARDQPAAAQPACEQALAIRQKVLTSPHPLIATTQSNLGQAHLDQGRIAEATRMFREALDALERRVGPSHMWASYPLVGLAEIERRAGRRDEAESLLRRALAIREKSLGPDATETRRARTALAELLREMGRGGEADALVATPPAGSGRGASARTLGIEQRAVASREPTREPGAGDGPVPAHRLRRDAEDVGRLIERQPGKVAKLDEAGQLGVHRGESVERLVEREDVHIGLRRDRDRQAFEIFVHHARAALARQASARLVHEDSPHRVGGGAEEVRSAVPVDARLVDEAEVSLVDQRPRVEHLARALASEQLCSDGAHLPVHLRHQRIERVPIACLPLIEQLGDIGHSRGCRDPSTAFRRRVGRPAPRRT